MGIVNKILKVFVGDKSEKDVKSLRPLVEAVKEAEKELENFDLDELRTQSANFKKRLKRLPLRLPKK
jgi:preprotein translocase subunit SecA